MDKELIDRPRRWNIAFIRQFMMAFGFISSIFDYLTFVVLLFLLRAGTDEFRTGWFVESVISAATIVLVIRTRRAVFQSRPGTYLLMATWIVAGITVALPYSPLRTMFGFTRCRFRSCWPWELLSASTWWGLN